MRTLTAFMSFSIVMGVFVAPVSAQTSYSTENFTAQKLCNIARAPRGFRKIKVFVREAEYPRPLFDVYQSVEKKSLLVSNINDGCWLRIDMKTPALSITSTPPSYAGDTINMEVISRKLSEQYFWEQIGVCNNRQDEYILSLYYLSQFRKEFSTEDDYADSDPCYLAVAFATNAMIIQNESKNIIVDIVSGVSFFGEFK